MWHGQPQAAALTQRAAAALIGPICHHGHYNLSAVKGINREIWHFSNLGG
jgi:hypothetical protein